MNSIRLGAILAVFVAGQSIAVAGDSQISYTLLLGGNNNAASWKTPPGCNPATFSGGDASDGQTIATGMITWAAKVAVSGTHSNGFPPSGVANMVFSLELHNGTDTSPASLVADFGKSDGTTKGFYSTINDGTARGGGCGFPADPDEIAAFAVSYSVDPANFPVNGRVVDPPTAGGPYLDYFQYPSTLSFPAGSTAASGVLAGVGAGYSKFVGYGCPIDCGGGSGLNTAGVGKTANAANCDSNLGVLPVVEGQIVRGSLLPTPPGTVHVVL
jgi:hypothetical protein